LKEKCDELMKRTIKKDKTISAELEKNKKKLDIEKAQSKKNKIWDHCHITSKFCGAAYNSCNLKLQIEA
jgi:hypothetical protein